MPAPRYKSVVDDLASSIRSGRLAPGARLPTHRALAADEGIALATATRVYVELEAMGLVSREQGRGTFVRDLTLPPGHGVDQRAVGADTVDLSFNYPVLPGQADLLRDALRDLAGAGDLESLLRYQPHGGRPQDRAVAAEHLVRRGLAVGADDVVVVNGAQHGLAVAAMALLRPGDVVAVDALTYPGFRVLAETLRLELAPVPSSMDGPDLDALARLCARRAVRAAYVMPTVHNPLGWVLASDQRERLVEIARRHDLLLLEDASYAYLDESPPPPLAALAPERTLHVAGISKSVATGLRVGFLTVPAAHVPAVERVVRATTWNTPALTVAIACGWLADGTVDRLEHAKRVDAAARQVIVREELLGWPYRAHPQSYVAWLTLPEDARADRVAATLAGQGIAVSSAEPFATTTHVPQALRLALGSTTHDRLRDAMAVVRRVVAEDAAS
ncbi:aminotransferase-like domain-containing protein [Nocardioides marmoraquaticus]